MLLFTHRVHETHSGTYATVGVMVKFIPHGRAAAQKNVRTRAQQCVSQYITCLRETLTAVWLHLVYTCNVLWYRSSGPVCRQPSDGPNGQHALASDPVADNDSCWLVFHDLPETFSHGNHDSCTFSRNLHHFTRDDVIFESYSSGS